MESQCDYFMYFPAAPISSLSDPKDYASLPRRDHVYLGEVVQFLLVLRSRRSHDDDSWKELAGSLSAVASACVAESRARSPGAEYQPDIQSTSSGEEESGEGEPGADTPESSRTFSPCSPRLIRNSCAAGGRQSGREPVKSALVLEDRVVFSLAVSLDKLPVNTLKAKIVVTVWRQGGEDEVEELGYLTLLQLRSPMHTFRQDLSTFKAQGTSCSASLDAVHETRRAAVA
ncbi:putative protein C7orf43 [Liparis tanakae]|uniref:TRAPP14 N-terminal domain-containing protein n=1 Tax=Liparis tanakae TaxID=230148 RepID=A0A4Z2FVC9_9TELE|nr:putative protein C7orf43 [Liparis tanakae]